MCYSPGAVSPGTMAAEGLNGRVRDGNGCFPLALITSRKLVVFGVIGVAGVLGGCGWVFSVFLTVVVRFCLVWGIIFAGRSFCEPAGKMVVKPHGGLVRVG